MRRLLPLAYSVFLLALVLAIPFNSVRSAPPLSDDDAAQLRQVIRPHPGEDPFETIPWEIDLWTAREKAAVAGKPILLWEMDGHPLGCG